MDCFGKKSTVLTLDKVRHSLKHSTYPFHPYFLANRPCFPLPLYIRLAASLAHSSSAWKLDRAYLKTMTTIMLVK